jgi:tetratricopeptide (TPR) repeat protein
LKGKIMIVLRITFCRKETHRRKSSDNRRKSIKPGKITACSGGWIMKRLTVWSLLPILLILFYMPMVVRAAESKEYLTDQCRKQSMQYEYPEAIESCGKAIKMDAKNIDAYFWRGVAFVATRQYDKAIEDFSQVLAMNPKDVQALSNRGLVYRRLKQYDKAMADLNLAIETDPAYAEGWLSRGTVFAQMDQWNDAVLDYSEGIKLTPQNYTAYHNRGIAYEQMGKKSEAINDFRIFLQLAPPKDHLRASVEQRIKTLEEGL